MKVVENVSLRNVKIRVRRKGQRKEDGVPRVHEVLARPLKERDAKRVRRNANKSRDTDQGGYLNFILESRLLIQRLVSSV